MNEKSKLPYNYGFARIGSVMNCLTREFNPVKHAFDMSQLNALGRLQTKQPMGELTIDANSFSNSEQNSNASSGETKSRAGFPFFKTTYNQHTSESQAKLNTANGLSLKIKHSLTGCDVILNENVTPEELYACATPNFKAAYDKVANTLKQLNKIREKKNAQMEGTTAEEKAKGAWMKACDDFQTEFGHGFISKLKLISTASGELLVSYDSETKQNQNKHGREYSLGGAFKKFSAGASHAKEWVEAHSDSESNGSVSAQVESIPGISSVANWANSFITEYAGKGIDTITEKPPTSISAPTSDVKAPEIPSVSPPEKKPGLTMPPITLNNTKEMVEYMRMQEMRKENSDESWKNFSEKFNVDAEKAKPEKIVEEVRKENEKGKEDEKKQNHSTLKTNRYLKNENDQEPQTNDTTGISAPKDISLGEYDIYDFEFTNYSKYFPALATDAFFPTRSGLNITNINMYLMTRQLIGSYFNYISQLPVSITGGYINSDRAASYERTLYEYSNFINSYIKGKEYITDKDFKACTAKFDEMLEANTNFAKIGIPVYNYFNKYYKTLSKAPFGFMLTAFCDSYDNEKTTRVYAPRYKGGRNNPKDFVYLNIMDSLGYVDGCCQNAISPWRGIRNDYQSLAKDSIRFIPVIHGGDNPSLVLATYISHNSWWSVLSKVKSSQDKEFDQNPTLTTKESDYFKNGKTKLVKFHLEESSDNKFKAKFCNSNNGDYYKLIQGKTSYLNDSKKDQKKISMGNRKNLNDTTTSYEKEINATFIPIDYNMVEQGPIEGIPMWQDFPFQLLQNSITAGFESANQLEKETPEES